MNKDFFIANDFYLVDKINGEDKKSKILFNIINNSTIKVDNAVEVAIENKSQDVDTNTGSDLVYQGFIKSSIDSYKDELELINSEIADLFDVNSTKIFKVINSNNVYGIVNVDSKEKDEQKVSVDILINKLVSLIKSKGITLTSWLKDYFSLPKTSPNMYINKEKDIVSAIEMTLNTLNVLFRLNNDEYELLKSDYIKMIFFDLISNNYNRTFNNYSVVMNTNSKFKKLSPVYTFNNELDVKSYYILNNIYIDKDAILSTLFHKYYPYIKKISRGISDNYGLYLESINLIIDNNIKEDIANQLKNNYKTNIETIKSLENINSKEYPESKLDLAMTQTSINLNALNKNQMIHCKYKVRKQENIEKVEGVSEIKIKVEPKKKESNTFSKVIIGLLIVALLVGIGIGIFYIIKSLF